MNRVKSANAFKPAARMARAASGLAVSIFAMLWVPSALAQSALGNGQSLQRNLHRFNQSLPGRDPLAASRYQNSIVNGNAPSGQSFRGNLGYRNSSDFQGKLGSNDLFNFSRDSSFSGLAGRGIRGSQLNDYQGALARGERGLSASLGGVFDVQRQGTNYNKSSPIISSSRSAGRRDTFGAASLGNSRLSGADSFGSGGDSGDSLQSSLRSSLEASLSSNLGKQKGTAGGAGRAMSRGVGSMYGTDNLLADSLNSARSNVLDRSITANDRALGLSGATSDAMRDRSRGTTPVARPGQVPTNKVGGTTGAGLGPDLAVPKLKTSFDDLQERLNKLDATPNGVPGRVPLDSLPDVLPGNTPGGTSSSETPGSAPEDKARSPRTNPDGTIASGQAPSMTWQSRMEDLRGQLAGEPGKAGKVSLLGEPKRTTGFIDRRSTKPGDLSIRSAGDASPFKPKAGLTKGEGPSGSSGKIGESNAIPSRSGVTPGNATELPERFREDAAKAESTGIPRAKIDPKTLKLIRDAGGKVETFRPSGATGKDFFAEHMQAGERLLGEAMFFDAEERFSKAISVKPGDVTGHVGRIHAQMGSGLFRSAGFTLRRVLAAYPEATGQRYGDALLPTKKRMEQLAVRMRENLAEGGGTGAAGAVDGPIRRDSALLLAYLGFQTSDRKTVEEGIAGMTAAIGQDPEAKPGEDERLIELLRGVWLDDSFYKAGESEPADSKPAEK